MKNKNILWLLLLASLWGPSFLFIKVAVGVFPPLTLVAVRLGLAAIFLVSVLRMRGQSLPRGWDGWWKFIVMGFFANALPFALFSFGEQFTDSGAASIINGTTPIFTVILAHFFVSDERLTPRRLAGVLVGFAGILFLFWPELRGLLSGDGLQGTRETLGLLAFVGAAISYGFTIVFGRLYMRGLPPLVGPAAQLICSASMVLPLALWVERPFDLQLTTPAVASILALSFFGTAIAYLVYYRLVDSASATYLSLVTYLLPPVGVVLGVIFLHEQPGLHSLAGLGLIITGVMAVNGVMQTAWNRLRRASIA